MLVQNNFSFVVASGFTYIGLSQAQIVLCCEAVNDGISYMCIVSPVHGWMHLYNTHAIMHTSCAAYFGMHH